MLKRRTRRAFQMFVMCAQLGYGQSQAETAGSSWVDKGVQKLEQARELGSQYAIITFSQYRLWGSDGVNSPNTNALDDYREVLQAAQDLGMTPIGTSTTWVFPDFADAPLVPSTLPPNHAGLEEARIACIPDLGGLEYQRLSNVRNEMWATLAQEFSDVESWFVGYEPGLEFYDCSGEQIQGEDLFTYIVDTLEGVSAAIKSTNPSAKSIAHFLGRSGMPVHVRDELVQPQDIINRIRTEISARGKSQAGIIDDYAFTLEPNLLAERFPEEHSSLPMGAARSSHLDCVKTYCRSTAPH